MFNLKNNFYLHIINFNHIGLTCVHLFAGKKKNVFTCLILRLQVAGHDSCVYRHIAGYCANEWNW